MRCEAGTSEEQWLAALQQHRERRKAISAMEREDMLTRRREQDRHTIETETDEERQARFVNIHP